MTDQDTLLLTALQGHEAVARREAEHALFDRYRTPVDQLLRRMLGEDTDDCLQEAFVDVFQGLRSFEGKAQLSTWIYRVTLRRAWKCAARRRRQQRGREGGADLVEQAPDPATAEDVGAELAGEELSRRFAAALQRLDLDQRTVMALSALDGLGPAEISDVLGVPPGTVHSRMSRARARLRELLGIGD